MTGEQAAVIEEILKNEIGFNIHSVGERKVDTDVMCRMRHCGITETGEYICRLQKSRDEVEQLIELVTIPETWFFRIKGSFDYLEHYIRNEWRGGGRKSEPLRILCLPCSTGEEPYSIAMLMLECGLCPRDFTIDAADINQRCLEKAQEAVYTKNSFRGERLELIEKYFRQDGLFRVLNPEIKKLVNFSRCNMLDFMPPPLSYDIIFCRNMLIYLDDANQRKSIQKLAAALKENGLLFIGHSESGLLFNANFNSVHGGAFAFRKSPPRERARTARHVALKKKTLRGRPPLARPEAPQAVSTPAAATDLLDQAEQLADRGDLAGAETLCRRHLATHKLDAKGCYLLGVILQSSGHGDEAEKLFQRTLYLDSDHHEALLSMAMLKERQADPKGAAFYRERAGRTIKGKMP